MTVISIQKNELGPVVGHHIGPVGAGTGMIAVGILIEMTIAITAVDMAAAVPTLIAMEI
jgi:precorrin-6B methylase 2